MNLSIIAASKPRQIKCGAIPATMSLREDALYISGSNAGICYMNGSFFDEKVSGKEPAINRAERVLNTGHHSIANHMMIEVLFEGISKSAAMVLNNLKFYATSEKSGRYTTMEGYTKLEKELYDKWREKLIPIIKKEYPDMDDKLATKLAMENARMFIGVDSRIVTMGYSAAYNQWMYIIRWFESYYESTTHDLSQKTKPDHSESITIVDRFKETLAGELHEIAKYLTILILGNHQMIADPKHRHINPFGKIVVPTNVLDKKDCWKAGPTYPCYKHPDIAPFEDLVRAQFSASFAMVAQLQRHRTLNVQFELPEDVTTSVYIPDIIRNTPDETEWVSDMNKEFAQNTIPIGTNLNVRVTGSVSDYEMMLDERLCCRAQYEIMMWANSVHESICHLYPDLYPMSYRLDTKCKRNGKCMEPCMFIKDGLTNKKI